jgi:Carboxypeptidase regulatory-like domain
MIACSILRRQRCSWRRFAVRCISLGAFTLWVFVACGQQFRTVRGTVKDQNGHVLAGAVVQMEDRTTLQIRSYVTRGNGSYHFGDISADITYHLRAKYAGVFSREKILSKFHSDTMAVVDLTIDLAK